MPEVVSRDRNASRMMSNTQFGSMGKAHALDGGPEPQLREKSSLPPARHSNERGASFDPKAVRLEPSTMLGAGDRASSFAYKLKEPKGIAESGAASTGPEF